jgi:hypothetical protein
MRIITEKTPVEGQLRHAYMMSGLAVVGDWYRSICGYWVEATDKTFAGSPQPASYVCLICFTAWHDNFYRDIPTFPAFSHPRAVMPSFSGSACT